MSGAGSSWSSSGLALMKPNTWRLTKEKQGRALRQQIHAISQSSVLDEAGIEDSQILTLTREDLNELFPGIRNFQLRRTIMTLITDTVKDSLQHGPETLASALMHLKHKSKNNDAAVQDILKESLRAFRQLEDQLKAAQASLKPYIEVLNGLTEASARKEDWGIEGTSSRRTISSTFPTDMNSPTMQTHSFEPSVRVHPFVCGRTLGTDKQILAQLKGVKESDLWDCQLILAFSPVTSRAGTDAEEALKKIPADKPAVLVILHHTFNPTYVCPSLNIASSQVNIVEHVNVLFHDSHRGLLKCSVNETAITKLQSVLNRYM
ncbi:uncharacterized protein LOC109069034 isoform X1 [Cyprinus carpio]|uniref:Uncharacterized protein LOC109069034 isoform X1 n=1 Tax=Cyprinus carpio TaxID=7962 RepID=A0A9Q9ZEV7_CYPCA|nr:uncharacterized protein LOC109069034 isoform X1 [Cyprinus carpio]